MRRHFLHLPTGRHEAPAATAAAVHPSLTSRWARATALAVALAYVLACAPGGVALAQSSFTIEIEKLPYPINTDEYDEISPVASKDGRQLYFTRTGSPDFVRSLRVDGGDAADTLSVTAYEELLAQVYRLLGRGRPATRPLHRSRFNQDIWVAQMDGYGKVLDVEHPGPPLNNALPNALAARMPETGHYVTMNQFPRQGGMEAGFSHAHRRPDGSWTHPEPLEIEDYYTDGEGVGMTLSSDAEIMILSLERASGFGEADLYISRRKDSTTWSQPANLGPGINSAARESTPSLSEDKKTLYFSSNRVGRGGNDIYFCRRLDETWLNWSPARRFVPPITSGLDDSQPFFNEATGYLYLASRRDGSSDIFRVRIQPPRPLDLLVIGRVRDMQTKELLQAEVLVRPRGSTTEDTTLLTNKRGFFEYRVNDLRDLHFFASKAGYLGQSATVRLGREGEVPVYEVDIYLDKAERGGKISLDPIYFEQSLPKVKEESIPQLEHLKGVLTANPNVFVRIEGHTDNQGKPASLERLSRERAEAIRDYLVANGVERRRVTAAGFGATRPVTDNETLDGRVANRRVEVVITRILRPRKDKAAAGR